MQIRLKKLGKNFNVSVTIDGRTEPISFYDSAEVSMQYNSLANRVQISAPGQTTVTTDSLLIDGSLIITIGATDYPINSLESFEDAYTLLFPEGGSGPGTTPNLQQVTDEGNETTNVIISADTDSFASVQMGYKPGESGKIELINNFGNVARISNPLNENFETIDYRLPANKSGSDIFAMVSDLPANTPYEPAFTGTVNIAVISRNFAVVTATNASAYTYKVIQVYFSFNVNSIANGLVSFEIPVPYVLPIDYKVGGHFSAAANDESSVLAGIVKQGSDDTKVRLVFVENAGGTARRVTGCFVNSFF